MQEKHNDVHVLNFFHPSVGDAKRDICPRKPPGMAVEPSEQRHDPVAPAGSARHACVELIAVPLRSEVEVRTQGHGDPPIGPTQPVFPLAPTVAKKLSFAT